MIKEEQIAQEWVIKEEQIAQEWLIKEEQIAQKWVVEEEQAAQRWIVKEEKRKTLAGFDQTMRTVSQWPASLHATLQHSLQRFSTNSFR